MTQEIVTQIFELCVIPLLGVLTGYIVKWLNKKSVEIQTKTDNINCKKYIAMLTETIDDCIVATNQTYVDALKGKNAFDEAAQKEAFNKTYQAVIATLSADAKVYLDTIYQDVDEYIKTKIEAEIKTLKTTTE